LAAELLNEFEFDIDQMVLIPSTGGRFDVEVNGANLFSKLKAGRQARSGEILELVRNYLKETNT
jgi:selenoprotein W-related protein